MQGRAAAEGAGGVPRFVGRDGELDRVVRALAAPPALVLVEGEAGIGKTRLVREALAAGAARGRRVLHAVCPPFREGLTLGPVVDAVRQARSSVAGLGLSALAGALRPLFPEWAADLPPAPEPPADAGAARHRLIRALAELLDRLGVDVLVVEDVHWADDATLDLLVLLATRRPQPLSMVLTHRPEDLPPDSLLLRLSSRPAPGVGHTRIALGGLGVDDTARLVSSLLDAEHVSDAFAGFLHDRTEGVPLAVEESVRLMRDRSDLIRRDGAWVRRTLGDLAVPPTIRDAVTERVARLGAPAQAVLLAAAVLGEPVPESVLAQVSGLPADQARDAVDAGLRGGLLAEDDAGRVGFRHALAARAVYDRAPAAARRDGHHRAAAVLEAKRPDRVGALARHLRAAGEIVRWRPYAEKAADLALASGDHVTAVTFLHDLVHEPGLPPAAVAPLVQRIPLMAFTGDTRRAQALAILREVLAHGGLGRRDRADVRGQLGRVLIYAGEYTEAAAVLEAAIPDLADRPRVVAWAMTQLGVPVRQAWTAAEHRRWLERAAGVVASSEIDAEGRVSLLVDRFTALLHLGEESGWELAARLGEDESTPPVAMQRARGALNTGHAAMNWGRYAVARRALATALEAGARHHYQRLGDMALVTVAHLDYFTGAWAGLRDRAGTWVGLEHEAVIDLDARLVTARLAAADADAEPPLAALEAVVEESTRRGVIDMAMEAAGAAAAIALAAGDPARALDLTDEGVRLMARKDIWLWATEVVPVRVAALVASGREADAAALTGAFGRGLGDRDAPAPRAALATCAALLASGAGRPGAAGEPSGARDPLAAAGAWQLAAAAWQALPRPYEALLARERRAGCLLDGGERDAGLAELAATARELSALGASRDAARVVRALNGQGVAARVTWRGGRRGYGDELSPREREVVALLLDGLTNREIAERLSRSPKTVATQLNSAMRKFGVASRTALAVAVTRGADGGA